MQTRMNGGDIQQDIAALKDSIASLTSHIQKTSQDKVAEVKEVAQKNLHTIQEKGKHAVEAVDVSIKENPKRSLAIAFLAGVLLNTLFKRR